MFVLVFLLLWSKVWCLAVYKRTNILLLHYITLIISTQNRKLTGNSKYIAQQELLNILENTSSLPFLVEFVVLNVSFSV
jgi:hypothetical protein